MFRRRSFFILLSALACACSGGSPRAAPETAASAASATSEATAAPLTAHEQVACRRWEELRSGGHRGSVAEIYRWVRFDIANEAWVDAPNGRAHQAALAMADAVQGDGSSGTAVTTAGEALEGACASATFIR